MARPNLRIVDHRFHADTCTCSDCTRPAPSDRRLRDDAVPVAGWIVAGLLVGHAAVTLYAWATGGAGASVVFGL